jgi:hypothetical protein
VKCQARPRLALSGQPERTRVCPLTDKSGHRWILVRDRLSAYDPKRYSGGSGFPASPREGRLFCLPLTFFPGRTRSSGFLAF